jgi:hypothetical protein
MFNIKHVSNEKNFLHRIFSANGLKFAFDVKTTLNISDIAFYPSQTTHSYDIYASSIDKEDILFLDLTTGEIIFLDLSELNIFLFFFNLFKKLKIFLSVSFFE